MLVFRSGGYYPPGFGVAALVLLAAAAAAATAVPGSWTAGGLVALCGLLGLSAWQLVGAAHADDPELGRQAATLTALYAAAGALTLLGMRRAWLPRLVDGALLVCGTAAFAGLASRLFPSFGNDTEARLAWPLTYWNALGAAAGVGIVLAIGIAGAPRRSVVVRSLAAATVPPLLLTLVMTFSRGGALVAFVGLVVALALAPGRIETVAALVACAGPAGVLAWLATREDGLVQASRTLPPHAAAGHRIAIDAACASVIAAGLAGLAATGAAALPRTGRRATGVAIGVVAIAAAATCLVVFAPARGYSHQISKTAHQFTQKRQLTGSRTSAYLTASGTGRWEIWTIAAQEWRTGRVAGTGPGDFRFWWDQRRVSHFDVVNAHNLYLETLAESGVIGLGLLLLLPVGLAAGMVSLRRGGAGSSLVREASVACGACAGVLVHAAFDWDWQLPALMLPVVVLAFGVIRAGDTGARLRTTWAPVLAVPFVALAVLLAGGVLAGIDVQRGKSAAANGELTRALALAQAAVRHDPGAAEPRRLEANVLADLGRPAASDRAFQAALARSPRSYVTYADWASLLLLRGDDRAARLLLRRSLQLNPQNERSRLLARLAGLGQATKS